MLKRIFWITSIFWTWSLLVSAQSWDIKDDFQTKFTQLTTKDGLSDNRILDMIEDRQGFIWLATENGLNRFDGYEFVVFQNVPIDTFSISSNIVTSIAEDIYGNLWIGTVFGLNKYNRTLDQFTHYFYNSANPNSIRNNHIRAILADEEGVLWIETVDGFLHSLDIKSGKIEYYKHRAVSQPYYHYHDIFKENDSILWIGGRNSEVLNFNIFSGKFDAYLSARKKKLSKKTNDVSSYFKDSKGNFWVTGLDGAYILDRDSANYHLFLTGSTFCILEEKDGSLWFGTGNGIYKYHPESNQMSHITAQRNNPHSLSDMHINKMMEDASGVLWIATNNGLSLYSPKKNNFSHYFHIPGQSQTISGDRITALAQDKSGELWIGTAAHGLNKMNLENGRIEKFEHQKGKRSGLISNHISSLFFDSKDDLWIATWSGKGFNKLHSKSKHFSAYTIDPTSTNFDWYNGFLEGMNDQIYLAVWGGYGIYSLPNNSNNIIETGKDLTVIPNEVAVTSMESATDSLLWLGGTNGQINFYNLRLSKFSHIKNLFPGSNCSYQEQQLMHEYGFIKEEIPYFDRIHQIVTFYKENYFATESGLIQYNQGQKSNTIQLPQQLKEQYIQAMSVYNHQLFILSHGTLWILSHQTQKWNSFETNIDLNDRIPLQMIADSLHLWLASEEYLYQLDHQGNILSSEKADEHITSLKISNTGDIWIASNNKFFQLRADQLELISKVREEIVDFLVEGDSIFWLSNKMFYLSEISNNKLEKPINLLEDITPQLDFSNLELLTMIKVYNSFYIGSNKGIIIFHKAGKSYFIRHGEKHYMGFPVHLLNCIGKSSDNGIWLGTTSTGISHWCPEENSIINYWSNEFDSAAFWGKDVSFIYTDSRNQIWMGAKGLNLYHPLHDSFSHFTTANGLPHNQVRGMVEDEKGRLWIATKNGLSCFSIPEQNFTNYFESDGLPDNELTGAAIKLDDGRLAFGSINGLAVFHPDSLHANHYIPPVVITEVLIQDNQIFRDLIYIDTLVIAADENRISIRFAALDYNSPEQNKYQYKMVGIDDDWVYTDANNRVINYTNLSSGTYEFKLKGSNNNEIWNEYGKSITIIILPHYYEQWWFYILLILLSGLIIWMIILYRVRELRLQQKAAELEQRFLRAQMNPHFIFNSLGAIQSFIFKNEPIEAATYLSNFSELVRLILDNSRQDLIPIQTEVKTLDHYLD
ncbi:MAG: hypothetical protein GQ527_13475, partial [Bacteroidales bacterium]|nr:hypothetical protein [Bacteroidales bacterium]